MKKKRQFIFFGVVMTISIAFFITASIMKNAKRHFTLDELFACENPIEEVIRVDGSVKVGSVKWNSANHLLVFELTDQGNKRSIKVFYKNVTGRGQGHRPYIPNNFQEGKGVVVEGIYNQSKKLIDATRLMTKCPSKYITEDMETWNAMLATLVNTWNARERSLRRRFAYGLKSSLLAPACGGMGV